MNTSRFSMYWNRRAILLIMAVSLALVVAACEGSTPTPTNTSAPTNTPTSEATNTPTSVPPTATATPAPTATATAVPAARQGTEEIRTSMTEVPFDEASTVWVYGSGFEPGTEVYLLIADSSGAQADITSGGGSVFPLIANDQGAWATLWTIGRFARATTEGQYSLTAVDTEYNVLATAPVAFCASEREEGTPVPNFCPAPEATAEPTATP